MEPSLVEPGDWNRGFSVTKQHISLSVDFDHKSIVGYTELIIKPRTQPESSTPVHLVSLQLHSRQCEIKRITVGGHLATFEIHDFLARVVHGNARDLKSYSALYAGDLEASERGELSVRVPSSLISEGFSEVAVRIEYELRQPEGTVYFVGGDSDNTPHMYTHTDIGGGNTIAGGCGARCWFPCVDTVQSQCPFELEITVDSDHVAVSVGNLLDVVESEDGRYKTYYYLQRKPIAPHNVALAVGPFEAYIDPELPFATYFCLPGKLNQLIETTACIPNAMKQLQSYLKDTPFPYPAYKQVFVDSSFCYDDAAPYASLAILSDAHLISPLEAPESGKIWQSHAIQARCLAYNYFGCMVPIASPADVGLILGITGFLSGIYLRNCVGVAAESEYLRENVNRVKKAAHRSSKVAEQRTQAGAILGRSVVQPEPARYPVDSELWAARGMSFNSVLSARCLVMMHMLESKVTMDIFHKVICDFVLAAKATLDETFGSPVTECQKPGSNSSDNTVSRSGSGIVLKLSYRGEGVSVKATNAKGETVVDPNLRLSEVSFMTKLRTTGGVHGQDINTTYVNQWLRLSGVPILQAGIHYHRSGNKIEMAVKQVIGVNGRRFQGTLQVKVVEDDGSWVHEKRLEATNAWMFPCHSQPARKKKGRKRKGENVEEQWRDSRNLQSAENLINMVSGPRSLRVGRKSRYWTNETPVRYVVIDPRMCWLRELEVTYSEDFMLLEMLEDKDNDAVSDVIGQCFALESLTRPRYVNPDAKKIDQPGERIDSIASTRAVAALAACLLNPKKPPVVRAEAAVAIAMWQNNHAPQAVNAPPSAGVKAWIGAEILELCFKKLFTENDTLLSNDFRVKGESIIKPAIAKAFSIMQARDGEPPPHALRTVLTMLRENDNSFNPYSDGSYLAQVIKASANILVNVWVARARAVVQANSSDSKVAMEFKIQVLKLLHQYLDYDALAPSPHHIVTAACLKAFGQLEGAGVITPSVPFFAYAVYGDGTQVNSSGGPSGTSGYPGGARSGQEGFSAKETLMQVAIIRKRNWGVAVREAAFKAIIRAYLTCRVVTGADWMSVFQWVLTSALCEPCPALRHRIFLLLLKAHSDTVADKHRELENHTSPSGAFWLLSNAPEAMSPAELQAAREVAGILWQVLNEGSAYDGRLRCLAHQLWRAIWGFDIPPVLFDLVTDRPNIEPFNEWVENFEIEKGTELAEANITIATSEKTKVGEDSPNRKRSMSSPDNGAPRGTVKLKLKRVS